MGRLTRIDCELCGRAPGGVHADECPRSSVSQRALHQEMRALGAGRLVWQFGVHSIATPTGNEIAFNPNLPYVNPASGKPWSVGGIPAAAKAEVEKFKNALQLAALGVR